MLNKIYKIAENFLYGKDVQNLIISSAEHTFKKKYFRNNTTDIDNKEYILCKIEDLSSFSNVNYLNILQKRKMYDTVSYPVIKNEFIDTNWLKILNNLDREILSYGDVITLKKRLAVFMLIDKQEPFTKNFIKYGDTVLFCVVNNNENVTRIERHIDISENIYIKEYDLSIT